MTGRAPRLPVEECARLMREEGYVYLDVRSEPEFEQGHPQGAFNVPLQHPGGNAMVDNPDFLSVVQRAFDSAQKLVVGCRSGDRSQTAAAMLVDAGFEHVIEARSGFLGTSDPFGRRGEAGWYDAGLPSSTRAEPGRDYRSLSGS